MNNSNDDTAFVGCDNAECKLSSSCARFNDRDVFGLGPKTFGNDRASAECREFLVRKSLGGLGNTDAVFSRSAAEGPRAKRIHNPHAGVRQSYPGSAALFGEGVIRSMGKGRSGPRQSRMGFDIESGKPLKGRDLPKKPDLMVKRHLRGGKNINNPEE